MDMRSQRPQDHNGPVCKGYKRLWGWVMRPFAGHTRWVFAVLAVVGLLLQVVEFLLENPKSHNATRVAYWSVHEGRVSWSNAVGLLAVPFLIAAFGVMVTLCRRSAPRLAVTAGALLLCGMVGLAALHGYELAAQGLTRAGERTAAVNVLDGNNLGPAGGMLLVLFIGGALFGTVALAIAMWQSPLVPRLAPVLLIAFVILDAAGYPLVSHLVGLGGGLVVAAAIGLRYDRSEPPVIMLPEPRGRNQAPDAEVSVDHRSEGSALWLLRNSNSRR